MSAHNRLSFALVLVVPLLGTATPRGTEDRSDALNIVVMPFDGAQALAMRSAVFSALRARSEWHVVPLKETDDVVGALRRQGSPLLSPGDVGETLHARVILFGHSRRDGGTVQILSGRSGALLAEVAMGASSLVRGVQDALAGGAPRTEPAIVAVAAVELMPSSPPQPAALHRAKHRHHAWAAKGKVKHRSIKLLASRL